MTRTKKIWIAAAVSLAIILGGAGIVLAQTPGTSGTGTTFLDRVAQKLGIDTPKLKDAIKSAGADQLDQAVQNGDLTQKQADNIRNRLDQRVDNGDFGFAPGHGKPFAKGRGFGLGLGDAGQKLADFLGISTDQLKQELAADGATLAKVAEAHGKSRDDLKAFIRDGVKQRLDQAVQDQNLTQKQEDNILSALDQHLDQLIDSTRPWHGFGGFFGRGRHEMGGPPAAQPQGGVFGGFDRG